MTTPPSSPLVDHSAIAGLQTAASTAATPGPPIGAGAASALTFDSTNKRHFTYGRDRAVLGVSSPAKKRLDARLSPRKGVSINRCDVSEDEGALNIEGLSVTPHPDVHAIPSITPSPPTEMEQSVEPPMPPSTAPPKKKQGKYNSVVACISAQLGL